MISEKEQQTTQTMPLLSFCDKKTLAARSHYPLFKINLYRNDIEMLDEYCTDKGISYTILSGYHGTGKKGPVMIAGMRAEDRKHITEFIVKTENKIYEAV